MTREDLPWVILISGIGLLLGTYATDGRCHNAQPGTFNHECGKPATWIGRTAKGFESGFCDDCKERGFERHQFVAWRSRATDLPNGYPSTWPS